MALRALLVVACLLSSVPACRANALTHTVTLAYATGETADVCIAANVCINRTAGLFVLGDATTPSCPPALLVHERADAAFVPRVERGLPRDSVLWSTKQLALVFSRFWPENAGHALHNDLVAVLVTWRRAMLVSGVPYGPDVAQAISLDDFSADPEDYMNRLKHVYAELRMGPLLQPPEFPEATLCFPQAVIGIGSFAGYEGFPRLTPEDVQGARGYVGAALGLEDRAERDGRAMRVALLTRGGTRRFLNEEAIAGALGARGFPGRVVSVLHNNAASFREQLLSLWDADLVISPHGAQLSYAWFVSRLALVEVIPFGHNIVLTKLAAQSAGQPYVRMGLTRQQSVLDVGALSPEARDDLERLRAENATLHDQLLREFRCPPGGWRLACSLILDRDLAVDTDRLVWVADTLAQLGRFLVPE